MSFNKLWCDGIDMCTIVQDSHAALPIDSYSGYILAPIPLGKGIQDSRRESGFGILCLGFHYPGAPLVWSPFLEGFGLSSLCAILSL